MKKGLLGSTALIGAAALIAGVAGAAEAPTWKLTGNANFQFYYIDQDLDSVRSSESDRTLILNGTTKSFTQPLNIQDHGWYFGVDESELQLNVSGTADNGLNYGFKIEIQTNTTDGTVADEARLQFSGGWGTIQLGDEDGAEDIMNYGGESLMGATGGFDGDQDDYLVRGGDGMTSAWVNLNDATLIFRVSTISTEDGGISATMNLAAPSYASIAGDTSDRTKVSYFSPRFSGSRVGDSFKEDGSWENHIGVGANYDNSFGDLRIRASVIYSTRSNKEQIDNGAAMVDAYEGVSAFSVGGIVGWGPFSLGANYTDNGD